MIALLAAASFFPLRFGTMQLTWRGGGVAVSKVAVTVVSPLNVTTQLVVPEQPPPDQPAKAESEAGVAVSVTWVPAVNACEHVEPQSIPAGLLVTLPEAPARLTVRVWAIGAGVVSIVHWRVTSEAFPMKSRARTVKVWLPSARPEKSNVPVHGARGVPSTEHWKVGREELVEKVKLPARLAVVPLGPLSTMFGSGCATTPGSTRMREFPLSAR